MGGGVFSERVLVGATFALCLLLGLLDSAGVAEGRTPWHPCDQGRLSCARVSAPLDPSGRVPGRVSLFVERYAVAEHPSGTIVALAGGPGQSGVDLFGRFRNDFQDLLGTHALVMFDDRGVGRSGQLDCRIPIATGLGGGQITACARTLGSRGRFYSTDNTVADIETIRRTLGLGRIDLYGVSYGTFAATQYARRFPAAVAHLVLDSSLPADGDLDVDLSSFASIRRQLATICVVVCPGVDPTTDLDRLLARLPGETKTARERGVPTRAQAGGVVLNALNAADLDPFVRASIPSALALAAGGDMSAVIRLGDLAVASETAEATAGVARPTEAGGPSSVAVDIEPIATRCEDERFAWSPEDSLAVRESKARGALGRLSDAGLAPFSPGEAIAGSVVADCERWPSSGAQPPRETGRLPGVPTLILSGEDDVRTPLEQAESLAGEIPGARVLAVPNVGHAVLADDHSGCARRAVEAFLTDARVLACRPIRPPPVDPLPPASISVIGPVAPLSGEAGEVLAACVITLRHDVGEVQPYLGSGLAVSGTRGGGLIERAIDGQPTLVLEAVSYIRSVALTGRLALTRGFSAGGLRVTLARRTYGTLRLSADGAISGKLGGRRFDLRPAEREAIDTADGLAAAN